MDTGSQAGAGNEYVARARRLAPQIAACADQIEQERRLASPVLDALFAAGMFRLLLPRSLDGGEVDPATFAAVIEEIAKADASTAWCMCQASGCSMSAAYLPPDVAAEVFGRFHDIHAVTQQLQGRQAHFETVGQFLLGHEPDTSFL